MSAAVPATLETDKLRFQPRVPANWKSFKVRYRYRQTPYEITLLNPVGDWQATQKIILDGTELPDAAIPLVDDHRDHHVEVQFLSRNQGTGADREPPAQP